GERFPAARAAPQGFPDKEFCMFALRAPAASPAANRLLWAVCLGIVTVAGGSARADRIFINNGYHPQITPFYCGPASMLTMLDSPAVLALNNNPNFHNNLFENALYAYSRPFNIVPILGTDPQAMAATLNHYDGFFHGYAWYGFSPFAGNAASRTLANALKDFAVPGTVSVHHGQHWIDVNGVTSIGTIAANQPYKITGFYVRDPWPLQGSLGRNRWLAYNNRAWFRHFTPNQPSPLPYGGKYVTVLEPLGPELPDNGLNDSTPPPP